jgi:starch synthase
MMTEKIKVLFTASEADPFVKVGGLGDVAGSLPAALRRIHDLSSKVSPLDIRLAIPLYDQVQQKLPNLELVGSVTLPTVSGNEIASIYQTNHAGLTVYLVSGAPIDNAPGVYSRDADADAEKFVFFSLACLMIPDLLTWHVDILHANDWHTAVSVHSLEQSKVRPTCLQETRTLLTVHNLPFMGAGSEKALKQYLVRPSDNQNLPVWGRSLPLSMGLASANSIVAVSPGYAREILTAEYGCDLQDFLATRKGSITGILNGIDPSYWNPATDTALARNFSQGSLSGKMHNKLALQKEFGLQPDPDIPLLIMVTRFDRQKGVDLAVESLKDIVNQNWQVILLGTGDPVLEKACLDFSTSLPKKVKVALKFDQQLSRRMYGGADFLLMPSRYEPCGLAQMISMRYGCLPIARATGGLADTIQDHHLSPPGTGFLFSGNSAQDLTKTILTALDVYKDNKALQSMQLEAMSMDYSWDKSAEQYYALYKSLTYKSRRET